MLLSGTRLCFPRYGGHIPPVLHCILGAFELASSAFRLYSLFVSLLEGSLFFGIVIFSFLLFFVLHRSSRSTLLSDSYLVLGYTR